MEKVEIIVPELATLKTGPYACECQRIPIELAGKEALVFWIVKLKEQVKFGETLCELEVHKITVEIPSPCDGRLVDICIEDGGICAVGSTLGYLAVAGEPNNMVL